MCLTWGQKKQEKSSKSQKEYIWPLIAIIPSGMSQSKSLIFFRVAMCIHVDITALTAGISKPERGKAEEPWLCLMIDAV